MIFLLGLASNKRYVCALMQFCKLTSVNNNKISLFGKIRKQNTIYSVNIAIKLHVWVTLLRNDLMVTL